MRQDFFHFDFQRKVNIPYLTRQIWYIIFIKKQEFQHLQDGGKNWNRMIVRSGISMSQILRMIEVEITEIKVLTSRGSSVLGDWTNRNARKKWKLNKFPPFPTSPSFFITSTLCVRGCYNPVQPKFLFCSYTNCPQLLTVVVSWGLAAPSLTHSLNCNHFDSLSALTLLNQSLIKFLFNLFFPSNHLGLLC